MYPNYDFASTLKSLTNFEESDLEENPVSLKSVSWEMIKEKFSMEVNDYVRSLQQKKIDAEKERQKSIEEIISRKKNKD